MKLYRKLKCCWLVLWHKEFYLAVVTDRYKDGSPLCTACFASKDTITATKKLMRGLNNLLKMQKQERKDGRH